MGVSINSCQKRDGCLNQHYQHNQQLSKKRWVSQSTLATRIIIKNTPTLISLITISGDEPVSFSTAGNYTDNILLGTEGGYYDMTDEMDQTSFETVNQVSNHKLTQSSLNDRWESSELILMNPRTLINIDPAWEIAGGVTALEPPDWWNDIIFQ